MGDDLAKLEPSERGGRPSGRTAFGFLLLVVFLDVLSLGVTLPVLPRLVVVLGGKGDSASVYGVFVASWQVAHLLAAPMLGALSDRYGRRPLLLISCLGLGLDYGLMAVASSLGTLMIGRLISGVTASTFSIAAAYVADTTDGPDRPQRYAWLGATFSTGFIVGPVVGGILGRIDLRLPFWVAGAVTVLTAAGGIFLLPESLPATKRTSLTLGRLNPIAALGVLSRTVRLRWLAAVGLTYFASQYVFQSAYALYVGARYGWRELEIGMALAGTSLTGAVAQTLLAKPISRRFGEGSVLSLALVLAAGSLVFVGWAPFGWLSLCIAPVAAVSGLARSMLQSSASREVGPSEQGRLHGALVCLGGLAGVVFPTIFTSSLSWGGTHGVPGLPFYVAAVCASLAAVVSMLAPAR
ncbi:MAG: MFS transporter [Myxococcales bacterium]|nr:MFS transporter [Myxococcales bacterium]